MEKYFYQISPRVAITVAGESFRVPRAMKLEKDEVKTVLESKKAVVKRRFSDRIETVTISNLDRLHNEKYMTESEYEIFVTKANDKRGIVADNTTVESKEEEVVESKDQEDNTNIEETFVSTEAVEEVQEELTTESNEEVNNNEVELAVDAEPINLLDNTEENKQSSNNNHKKYKK